MKKILRFLVIFGFLLGCNTRNNCTYVKPIDKNDGLKVSTLEEHNFDKKAFNTESQ